MLGNNIGKRFSIVCELLHLETVEAGSTVPIPSRTSPIASPHLRTRLAWYAGTGLCSCVLIFLGLRLDRADLSCPFSCDGDTLLILPLVKATVERGPGGHWRNERLGAPGILELHDFPVIDHLHFTLLWLLGQCVRDLGLLFNIYYLLTYPLTAVTAMLVIRQVRMSFPAAAVGGLLYAFLPYHYLRGESHYFLSAYWLVPLSLLPVMNICHGCLPLDREQGNCQRQLPKRQALLAVLLAIATASAGAYYAFFTCAFLAFAGLYGLIVFKKLRPFVSAVGLIGVIVVAGLINHTPAFLYQHEFGENPVTARYSKEADLYGLKIAHLILPIDDHNLPCLARIKNCYNSPFRQGENENRAASLGIVGTIGLIGLIASLLFHSRPGWPYKPLAGLTLFGVLLGTLGGLGSVFNLLVMPEIRAYNRISVFIAFFCILATLGTIDGLSNRVQRKSIGLSWLMWAAILVVGILDQTPHTWFRGKIVKALDAEAKKYRADACFFAEIERDMPPQAMIFCLPYIQYPESTSSTMAYRQARGYIHTNILRWSFGGMKGREADAWQAEVAFQEPREFLQRIVYRGFDGLFIDKDSFPSADETLDQIDREYASALGGGKVPVSLPRVVHEDGKQVFLDLRPYRDALRSRNPAEFEAREREEKERVAVIWLKGFWCADPPGERHALRWGPADGEVWFINPSQRVRTYCISMVFHPCSTGTSHMRLSGLVDDDFGLSSESSGLETRKNGSSKVYLIQVRPGRDVLRIHCTPPPRYYFPEDNRTLCYQITEFQIEELR